MPAQFRSSGQNSYFDEACLDISVGLFSGHLLHCLPLDSRALGPS